MFCIDSMHVGGTEMNAVRTAERLDPKKYDLGVICLRNDGPLAARYAAAGIPIYEFPISSLYAPATVRQGWQLAKFLRERKIDVFHAHDRYSNIFGVPWARLAGTPGVIASRRWWYDKQHPGLNAANRQSYRFAHVVLANSRGVGWLLTSGEAVPPMRVVVVPNFVGDAAFAAPKPAERRQLMLELKIPDGVPIVGIVANLTPVKDHSTLIEAFANLSAGLPSAHLVLVGEGPCRRDLEALATRSGVRDRVIFTGRQPNVPNLHHVFDVSVLSSVSEGLSNSILEAMAAGNPVVATDVGATSDAVRDALTGLLVPAGDAAAMAEAIDRLLKNESFRMSMGNAGCQRAREIYSPAAALGALEALYSRWQSPAAFHLVVARASGMKKVTLDA